jgi:hypothetical protein
MYASARHVLSRGSQTIQQRCGRATTRHFVSSPLDPVAKASNPIPKSDQRRKPRTTFRSRIGGGASPEKPPPVRRQPEPVEPVAVTFPTTNWIHIRDCPPLATLDDIVRSVDKVLDIEFQIGILDIDSMEAGTMVEPTLPWVKKAQVVLSTHGRPTNWRVEVENRSIVHAFLEHAKETEFMCVWKSALVAEWDPKHAAKARYEVSDSMVRVENGPDKMNKDHLRHLFRRYDLTTEGDTISGWKVDTQKRMFLVRFADPANARAAVREMQGIEVQGREIRLSQYPKQIF